MSRLIIEMNRSEIAEHISHYVYENRDPLVMVWIVEADNGWFIEFVCESSDVDVFDDRSVYRLVNQRRKQKRFASVESALNELNTINSLIGFDYSAIRSVILVTSDY